MILVNINHDFFELILTITDPALRNLLLALAVKLDLLGEPIPTAAEVEAASNLRALRRLNTPGEVVH